MGIANGNNTSMALVRPAPPVIPVPEFVALDAEKIVSLDLIRTHTKTDDIVTVTDEQLALYRAAAIEAAGNFTGHLFAGAQRMVETLTLPRNYNHDTRRRITHRARYPAASSEVYLLGPGIVGRDAMAFVDIGSRDFKLPNVFFSADFSNCCGPRGNVPGGELFQVMYLAGFESETRIPRGIVIGILKYIAWLIAHPGDKYVSVLDQERINAGSLTGTNSTVVASGALEDWRQYVNEA